VFLQLYACISVYACMYVCMYVVSGMSIVICVSLSYSLSMWKLEVFTALLVLPVTLCAKFVPCTAKRKGNTECHLTHLSDADNCDGVQLSSASIQTMLKHMVTAVYYVYYMSYYSIHQ
jgi:hypothetical protein